jgi:hypothetical protein
VGHKQGVIAMFLAGESTCTSATGIEQFLELGWDQWHGSILPEMGVPPRLPIRIDQLGWFRGGGTLSFCTKETVDRHFKQSRAPAHHTAVHPSHLKRFDACIIQLGMQSLVFHREELQWLGPLLVFLCSLLVFATMATVLVLILVFE